jgi:hypothetical protein
MHVSSSLLRLRVLHKCSFSVTLRRQVGTHRLHVAAGYTREEKRVRLHQRIKICEQWQQIRFLLKASRRLTDEKHGLDMLAQLSCIQLRSKRPLMQDRESSEVVMQVCGNRTARIENCRSWLQ